MAEPINAYDLSRDIAREIEADTDAVYVERTCTDEVYASVEQGRLAAIVEQMIRAAIKNGGIKP